MFTLGLAVIHAFKRNAEFNPELLYVATFLIDMTMWQAIGG